MNTVTEPVLELLRKMGLCDLAIAFVMNLRSSPPGRDPSGGGLGETGRFQSYKMGEERLYESQLERLFILFSEFDPEVVEFFDQRKLESVPMIDANGRRMTRDLNVDFLEVRRSEVNLVEVKPRKKQIALSQRRPDRYFLDDNGRLHDREIEQYLKVHAPSVSYLFWDESKDSTLLARNLNTLDGIQKSSRVEIPQELRTAVRKALSEPILVTLGYLSKRLHCSKTELILLILEGEIHVDLSSHSFRNWQKIPAYSSQVKASVATEFLPPNPSGNQLPEIRIGDRIIISGRTCEVIETDSSSLYLEFEDSQNNHVKFTSKQLRKVFLSGDLDILNGSQTRASVDAIIRSRDDDVIEKAKDLCRLIRGGWPSAKAKGMKRSTFFYWQQRMELSVEKFGNPLIGLLSKKQNRGNHGPKASSASRDLANDFLETVFENPKAPKVAYVYRLYRNACLEKKIRPISRAAFYRLRNARCRRKEIISRFGPKKWNEMGGYVPPNEKNDQFRVLFSFQHAYVDSTPLDIFLVDDDGNVLGKPLLVILRDERTACVLAYYVGFENAQNLTTMLLLRDCVARWRRLPQRITGDGGPEFAGNHLFELAAYYQIEFSKQRSKAPRGKAPVESHFNVLNQHLIHNLSGNSKTLKNPRSVAKEYQPERHATWSLPALSEILEEYFFSIHPSQFNERVNGIPGEMLTRDLKHDQDCCGIEIEDERLFVSLSRPLVTGRSRKIRLGQGIQVNGGLYFHECFQEARFENVSIEVRYDPLDAATVEAKIDGVWQECRSDRYEEVKGKPSKLVAQEREMLNREMHLARLSAAANAPKLDSWLAKVNRMDEEKYKLARKRRQQTKKVKRPSRKSPEVQETLSDRVTRIIRKEGPQ